MVTIYYFQTNISITGIPGIIINVTMNDRPWTAAKSESPYIIIVGRRKVSIPTFRAKVRSRPSLAVVHLQNYRVHMRQFYPYIRMSRKRSAEIHASQFIWVIRFNVLAGWQTKRVANGLDRCGECIHGYVYIHQEGSVYGGHIVHREAINKNISSATFYAANWYAYCKPRRDIK